MYSVIQLKKVSDYFASLMRSSLNMFFEYWAEWEAGGLVFEIWDFCEDLVEEMLRTQDNGSKIFLRLCKLF